MKISKIKGSSGLIIEYTLTRSKRETAAIYIRKGCVEVRVPLQMTRRDIDRFIAAKENWITEKLAISRGQMEQRGMFTITYGSMLLYRGREYPVAAREGNRVGFDGTVFYVPPLLTAAQIKTACVQIYRRLAKSCLSAKTLDFARRMGVTPARIGITGAQTRWGSCSGQKNLNFSWRIIMASDAAIDYVVVHELAHISELNHSARFWAIVEGVLPDYRERQALLKELQQRLAGESWGE
jgi:predicted metal-dependent hydrolase